MKARRYVSAKRTAAAAQTRQRLILAAAKLLRSPDGLQSLSLESVARAARVSRVTVYNQLGSRRGLLEAVFDEHAQQGGLSGSIPEVLAEPDPHAGLMRVIEIFCTFWSFDRELVARVYDAGSTDRQLREGLSARNERRRSVLSVLVRRLTPRQGVRRQANTDLVDILFAITAFPVFDELTKHGRDAAAACRLIQALAQGAIEKFATDSADKKPPPREVRRPGRTME